MMKEKAIPKAVPRKVKGTVLFTVVCVMMVLTVFLMGTLALAATANNRALQNYSQVQTQTSANAAVNSVIAAIMNNETAANAAYALDAPGKTATVSVDFQDKAMGTVSDVKLEYAGSKWLIDTVEDSATKGQMVKKPVIKVSATVTQGKASSTVAAYVIKGNVEANTESKDSNNNGFVTTGDIKAGNHVSSFGGTYVGFDESYKTLTNSADPKSYKLPSASDVYTFGNGEYIETEAHFNGTLNVESGALHFVTKSTGTGISVWGSLNANHDLFVHSVNATEAAFNSATSTVAYTKVPYIYVEKDMVADSNCHTIGGAGIPLNIFCGTLQLKNNMENVYADVYCYDENGTSNFSGANNEQLYKWTAKVMSPEGTADTHTAGNFYTKGNVTFSKGAKFDGDVMVEGDMTVTGGNVTITGNLYVGGTLSVSSGSVTAASVKCDAASGAINPAPTALRPGVTTIVPAVKTLKPGYTPITNYAVHNTTAKNKDNPAETIMVKAAVVSGVDGSTLWQERWNDCTLTVDGGQFIANYAWGPTATGVFEESNAFRDGGGNLVSASVAYDITPARYLDAGGNDVATPAIFPAAYEKYVILGLETYNSKPVSETQIVKTVYQVMNESDPFTTQYDANDAKVDTNKVVFKHGGSRTAIQSMTGAGFCTADADITSSSTPIEITDSCTISGYVGWNPIVFHVKENKEIWVVIDGLTMDNGAILELDDVTDITDETDATKKYKPTGTVNILLKGDLNFTGNNNTAAISQKSITQKIEAVTDASGKKYELVTDSNLASSLTLPALAEKVNINVYCEKTAHKLYLKNNSCLIANIKAPYMDLDVGSAGGKGTDIYYNGFEANDSNLKYGTVGCCIVHDFATPNNWTLLFVGNNNSKKPKTPGADSVSLMDNWTILYYENY